MEWQFALLFILGAFMAFLLTGMPIVFAFMLVNLIGVLVFWGSETGLNQMVINLISSIRSFTLLPIPLFILMGEAIFHSGLGLHVIDTLAKWMGRLPGRLGLLAVASGTMFSVLSGSSLATTATLGAVLVPEMEARGYKKPMSVGPILGSGGLAMVIPPSAVAVLLAALGEFSVGRLLVAGIIPGLIMATFYASYIILRCYFQPSMAPTYEVIRPSLSEQLKATVKYVLPLSFIVFLVLGTIFVGVCTPSEAAALGGLGSFILIAMYRRLSWEMAKKTFLASLRVTAMIFIIFTGARTFANLLAYSGAGKGIIQLALGLPLSPIFVIGSMMVVVLILGTFMDLLPIMMITLPIFMPIVHTLGFNPVWFGLLMLINMEMAVTTPPFGLNLYVMKGVAPQGTTMADIYKAGLPFLGCDTMSLILCMVFPGIVLWLPSLMF